MILASESSSRKSAATGSRKYTGLKVFIIQLSTQDSADSENVSLSNNSLICIPVQNQMAISCGSRAHLEKDSIAKVCFHFLLCTNVQILPLFDSALQILQLNNQYL